ncbi:hypothetical protein RAB80_014692 [Fusarium oxysporum f. sp. vasinfectum]|nr:hypothetical protein RAB80_014692 [Fusarium oxysporum f. sp. vasinfectum]
MTSSQTTAASTPSISDQPITGTSLDFFLFFNATYPDEDTQNTTGGSQNAFQDSIVVDGWGWEETDMENSGDEMGIGQ